MDELEYKFKMPIGDWSDDGHGKCVYFTVLSNKTVEDVREAHFKSQEILNVENICGRYEEMVIGDDDYQALYDLGYDFTQMSGYEYECSLYPSEKDMANIWIFLLKKADPELELQIVNDDVPMLPFYGYDDKKRHISYVGYGIFS